jgi:hypothetical protein
MNPNDIIPGVIDNQSSNDSQLAHLLEFTWTIGEEFALPQVLFVTVLHEYVFTSM